MSQELAKRCIWLNRVYTVTSTQDNLTTGEAEASRRLNILQKDLRVSKLNKILIYLVLTVD